MADSHYSRSYGGCGGTPEAAAVGLAAAETLYDVLSLPAGADAREIKAAFRRLARRRHPDVVPPEGRAASGEEFKRILAAYSILSDPDERVEYDRQLTAAEARRRTCWSSFSRSYSAGFSRRTWETDQCW
ncbi:unnamed protein product [Spirodela intermedia]|uniref:J domain-containing protein n=1 Tax=Spirodela intermedia TaxID=51605 RepID=A0A7I8IZ20_SPIIN|nr:unnamed protein product [Spirodela intermedia]CAA6663214.1 unnamed protein product [Spirodela intermedia]